MVQSLSQIKKYIILFLPVSLFISPFVYEFLIFGISIYFIHNLLIKKNKIYLKNEFFLILIFFSFYLILNFFINIDNSPSITRTFGFIRFILFAFGLAILFSNLKEINQVLNYWFLILILVMLDTYLQFFTGKNILGFESLLMGDVFRLSGFLKDEYKIAAYLMPFGLLSLGFLMDQKVKIQKILLFYIFLTTIIIFSGERSNTYIFVIISTLLIFLSKFDFKKKLLFIIFFISNILIINFFYPNIINRQFSLVSKIFSKNDIIEIEISNHKNKNLNIKKKVETLEGQNSVKMNYFFDTQYASHYYTAIKIFKDNILFGSGIKTFRNVCKLNKYSHNLPQNDRRCSTHPHNIILEFLSELGLFGFLIFGFFIIRLMSVSYIFFKKNRSCLFLSANLFFIFSFFPFLPKGSFFTNWNATIFWMIFAIIIYYLTSKKVNN